VFFVKDPGTYKIIWDNTYSWFTGKTLKYRLSVLKPISQIDLQRKVDFEKLRNQMQNESLIENSQIKLKDEEANLNNAIDNYNDNNDELNENENENENENVNSKKELNNNTNKIMMVKFEGKNRAFKISNLKTKENSIKKIDTFLILPLVINGDLIDIYDLRNYNSNEKFQSDCIIQFDKNSSEENINIPYVEFFEKSLSEFLGEIKEEKKTILLNLLILEKPIKENFEISSLPEEKQIDIYFKETMQKMGFFPENLLLKYNNVKMFSSNLADICLMNQIYNKVSKKETFNNIIHLHFDKRSYQLSMYMEGVINDKISGLSFDITKNLIENTENVFNFIEKIINIFGEVDVNISFSHFEEK
jgi:hypothetical protein